MTPIKPDNRGHGIRYRFILLSAARCRDRMHLIIKALRHRPGAPPSLRVSQSTMHSIKLSDYLSNREDDHRAARAEWEMIKDKADYVVRARQDEIAYGENLALSEDEMMEMTDAYATSIETTAADKVKAPYGDEVHYCDNNMRGDGKKRFPVNCARVKAAWSYSHHKSIMSKYSSEQLSRLHSCIAAAYKKCHGEEPPSAESK